LLANAAQICRHPPKVNRDSPDSELNINAPLLGHVVPLAMPGTRTAVTRLALTDTDQATLIAPPSMLRSLGPRLIARLGGSEHRLAQRLASTVFLIRVVSAVLAFGSQILFARWMGSFEFGIYVYVWTWVLLLGQGIDLGLGTAAQRFIPQYREQPDNALLRGFLAGSRWLAMGAAIAVAALGAGTVWMLGHLLNDYLVIPLYLACITLPAYALANTQDGISRSHDWMALGMMPTYIVRQLLLTALLGGAYLAGLPINAETAMIGAALSIWLPVIGQFSVLNRRLGRQIEHGSKAYEFRTWLATSLPILLVEGFYSLLAYSDVLILQQFKPPDEVAIYYAAAKTLALVSFIYYAVSATTAHRFSNLHFIGDRNGLSELVTQSIKWTFWPSLATTAVLLAVGRPLLGLFGTHFDSGYHLMFILASGLLARAAIGPIERLLNMLGEQRVCAMVYAGAFAVNFLLCLLLIPHFGSAGAAIATAIALIVESLLLFWVTRRRLGLHVFIWGRREH
jgi:O-antigen/teichoic acid export membrane protein